MLVLCYIFFCALYSAFKGNYIDKWLFVGVSATLFHSLFSAVFLTPVSLFFSVTLFSVVTARSLLKVRFHFSLISFRFAFCFLPILSAMSLASEYYSFHGQKRFDSRLLEIALVLNPYNDRALYKLSDVQLRRERNIEDSLTSISRFIAMNPYHIGGLLNKAERLYQIGKLEEAQNTLDKVLDFYPSFMKAKRLQQVIQRKKLSIRRQHGNA